MRFHFSILNIHKAVHCITPHISDLFRTMDDQNYGHILAFLQTGLIPADAEVSTRGNLISTANRYQVNASGILTRNGLEVVKQSMQGKKISLIFYTLFSFFSSICILGQNMPLYGRNGFCINENSHLCAGFECMYTRAKYDLLGENEVLFFLFFGDKFLLFFI